MAAPTFTTMRLSITLPLAAPPLFMVEEAKANGILPGTTATDGVSTGIVLPVEQWVVGAFGDIICADGDHGPVYAYNRTTQKWATPCA